MQDTGVAVPVVRSGEAISVQVDAVTPLGRASAATLVTLPSTCKRLWLLDNLGFAMFSSAPAHALCVICCVFSPSLAMRVVCVLCVCARACVLCAFCSYDDHKHGDNNNERQLDRPRDGGSSPGIE